MESRNGNESRRLLPQALADLVASKIDEAAHPFDGGALRSARKTLRISVRELGPILNTSPGAIYSWERGKHEPPAELRPSLDYLIETAAEFRLREQEEAARG